jgi:protocatechuate 3,4-dioxygenase beta subunit
MRRPILAFLIALQAAGVGCAQDVKPAEKVVGGGCDGCELMFEGMPAKLGWRTSIGAKDEPGEPLVVRGVIYQRDGKSPAPGVILYVYQTDATGHYAPGPDQTHGRRHRRLRGWMKTDADGRYEFRTIRPAPYPGQTIPAHIHPVVKEPDRNEYYIDEFLFDDDPLLTKAERVKQEGRGGSGVLKVTADDQGVLIGSRDIILGRNIPDYE